jgi:hypothetical protein
MQMGMKKPEVENLVTTSLWVLSLNGMLMYPLFILKNIMQVYMNVKQDILKWNAKVKRWF